MKYPKQMKISALTAVAVIAFTGFAGAAQADASAKNYFFLKAIPALKPKGGEAPPVPPSITLEPAVLPEGKEGVNYSYDLKPLVTTTGGKGGDATVFSLAEGSGGLPKGISLSSDGLLAGKPTAVTTGEGASFTVVGTYSTATGQQVYTIKVGESVLEATQIASGGNHTCAVTTAGGVKCWGDNSYGQLGNNSTTASSIPVDVLGLASGVGSVSAGGYHTCAVTTAGGVKCWGYNYYGQLGDGTITSSSVPVQVTGLTSVVGSITAGNGHTCASMIVKASPRPTAGGAKCWGYNYYGQLGNNSTTNSSIPVDVLDLPNGVSRIAAGNGHTCAVVSGAAKCWGNNNNGQLGDGTTTSSSVPVQVQGLASGVSSISAGIVSYACAVVSGAAKCWGNNANGQLGDGTTTSSSVPVQVQGLASGVSSINAGGIHTCAVVSGAAKCWGNNANGQLGDGTTTNSSAPVNVKAGN